MLSCPLQYILMHCWALMENQWRDKPATSESTQTQFSHWRVEGVRDWFNTREDFNIVFRELIDSHTTTPELSAKAHCLAKGLIFPSPPLPLFIPTSLPLSILLRLLNWARPLAWIFPQVQWVYLTGAVSSVDSPRSFSEETRVIFWALRYTVSFSV